MIGRLLYTGWPEGRHPQGGDVCSCNVKDKKEMANWTTEERAFQVDRAASARASESKSRRGRKVLSET